MPETATFIGSYFTAGTAATEGALAADGTIVAGTAAEGAATGAAVSDAAVAADGTLVAGTAAEGTAGAGATQAGVGSTLAAGAGKAAAGAAASGLIQAALAPKRPDLPKPIEMPDPAAQEAARQRTLIEQMSRRGRASTILTDSGSGTLGG